MMSSLQLRIETIEEYLAERITTREACRRLGLHRVTFWRLLKKYEGQGHEGLKHGLKGKRSNNSKPEPFRRAVHALYEKHYAPSGRSVLSFYQEVKDGLLQSVSYAAVVSWIYPFRKIRGDDVVADNVPKSSADTNSGVLATAD